MKSLKELKDRLMKDENFRKIYEERKPLMDFINDILELRYKKGWTQEDLAKAVGTAKSNISRIENGKQNLSYEMMQKLVKALGGKLLITAFGDRVVKLSEETVRMLDEISKRTGKTIDHLVEEIVEMFKDTLRKNNMENISKVDRGIPRIMSSEIKGAMRSQIEKFDRIRSGDKV